MSVSPTVSVCIAAYNAGQYVNKCLTSILSQTFSDLEIVIVDDASRDDTAQVIANIRDARVRLLKNEKNCGAPATYNRAVANARGKYINYFPSDDEMNVRTNLEEKVAVLEARPELGMVYSDSYFMDAQGNLTGTYWAREGYQPVRGKLNAALLLTVGMIICGHTALHRHAVLQEVGGFDTSLRHAHDGDLWLRIASNYPIDFIPKPMVAWRLHGNNSHGRGDPVEYLDRVRVFEKMAKKHPDVLSERTRKITMASYTALAGLQLVRKDPSAGRRYFWNAIKLCPYHLPALVWFANSYVGIPALWDFTIYKKLFLKLTQRGRVPQTTSFQPSSVKG